MVIFERTNQPISHRGRLAFLLYSGLLTVLVASTGARATTAQAACAFPSPPATYQDLQDRQLYLQTIDLAGFNLLFPGDSYFGLPDLKDGPRQKRGTCVDCPRPQAQKDRITRPYSHEAPRKKRGPPSDEGESRDREPDAADRRHDCDEAVADERRVGDNDTEQRETGQPGC